MIWGAVVVGQSAVLSSDYTKAKIAAMNIFMMIDRKPIKDLIPAYLIQEKFKNQGRSDGKISLRGVYFHYPLRPNLPILNGLSFKASKGEKVALVGSSGCGKSTTIQILERFYDCVQGKVVSHFFLSFILEIKFFFFFAFFFKSFSTTRILQNWMLIGFDHRWH